MLKFLLSLNDLGENHKEILTLTRSKKKTAVFGVPKSEKFHISAFLNLPVLYICANKVEADSAMENFKSYLGTDVIYLPAKGELLLSQTAFSKELYSERLTAIHEIIKKKPKLIVTTIEAVLALFPPKDLFSNRSFALSKKEEISMEAVSSSLLACGYSRVEEVISQGEFSIKGDILDIFAISGMAYRLDFFGDYIEIIKELDVETKRSSGDIESVSFYPLAEVLFSEKEKSSLSKMLVFKKPENVEEGERIDRRKEELILSLENNYTSPHGEFLPLIENKTYFLDYLSDKTVVVFDEFSRVKDVATSLFSEHISRFSTLFEKGQIVKSQIDQLLDFSQFINLISPYATLSLNSLSTNQGDLRLDKIINLKVTPVSSYQKGNEEILRDIKNWRRLNYTVVICGGNEEKARNYVKELAYEGAFISYAPDSDKILTGCTVIPEFLEHGFILQEQKIAIIGTHDVFKKAKRKISSKKGKNDAFLSAEVGDYVVHEVHGIGYLKSVSTIQTGETIKDYAVVEYKNGDTLYVPAENMDLLAKFSGTDRKPTLSKIGGKDFEKIKERVKVSIREMAINLKELYAKRERQTGYVYQEDTAFQQEFEDTFPFEETIDQLTCISEIKKDLTEGKIMDRLLVGDVGYGKTEVAFRAIFKVIEAGKQVCMLAPTTILSYQHYQNAIQRFKDFGIRIDYLNRLKNDKEQKLTLKKLKEGRLDLVFGTHRLLSNDVEFFDLGLLVLDEEQRFGVEHKEKIKTMKGNVNVLSMSATPIPRTLHMSLTGMRDISTIETPPSKRLPVQVIVTEETLPLIYDGITKELTRGGQVFVLYNKVESIYSFSNTLKEMMPDVRFAVAHGQMNSNDLERGIESFVLGEYDVLIATTIIENGIDIPRANTMFVIDSDKLGLSQLYQLKGRVGRSDKLAYVYYTFKENKILSDTAYKRLSAITEYTEFGSGFKIAMRDLEIRGSGNVLGREQHGHMEQVGYDMYCKLLNEAIGELDGKVTTRNIAELEMEVSAFIPESYITLSSARIEAYREIASISSAKTMKEAMTAFIDAYGEPPREMKDLMRISLIRHVADKIFATKVIMNSKKTQIVLKKDSLRIRELFDVIDKFKKYVVFDASKEMLLNFVDINEGDRLDILFDFMRNIEFN